MIKILYQFAKIAERADTVNVSRGLFTPFTLNNIWDNPGARRWPKILGRGNGSGKGNACGRGQRGQLSRSGGGVAVKFEGGQTPITRRLPKWGSKPSNELYREVNISSLVDRIKQGRIDINQVITIRDLWQAGLFKNTKYGVKLLARGAERISELEKPIQIEVSDASQTAIESIQKHGGKVTCVYRTPLLIHEHLHPERYELELRDPLPPSRAIAALKRIEERGAQTEYRVPKWVENEQKAKQNEQIIQKVEGEVLKAEPLKKEKEKSQKKIQKQQKAEAEKNKDLKKESIIELKEYPVSRKRGVGINKIRHRRQKLHKIIDLKL